MRGSAYGFTHLSVWYVCFAINAWVILPKFTKMTSGNTVDLSLLLWMALVHDIGKRRQVCNNALLLQTCLRLPISYTRRQHFASSTFKIQMSYNISLNWVFTALHVMQTRYSDKNSVRLSVRPFVCLSHAWNVRKRKKDLSRFLYHTKDNLA